MTDLQYVEAINRGHFLYWDMLGELRGIENHKEERLRWLTGDVTYNYFTDTNDTDTIISRMKNKEIPNNLVFLAKDINEDPSEIFRKTGLFKDDSGTTGMAHELLDTSLPKSDKRLNIFRVREISQLKTAGSILNGVFGYRLFSFEHYLEMMNNKGQYFYLAEYDGLPVGVCMSQHSQSLNQGFGDNFINISWVATLSGYRKLGIAGYLVQAAEKDGIENGKTIGTLHARPGAVGAYKRVGYKEYCRCLELELKEEENGK